jgi:hypothetical protein
MAGSLRHAHKGKPGGGHFIPIVHQENCGIKPSAAGSTQRVAERTGVTEGMLVRKNHTLFSNSLGGTK